MLKQPPLKHYSWWLEDIAYYLWHFLGSGVTSVLKSPTLAYEGPWVLRSSEVYKAWTARWTEQLCPKVGRGGGRWGTERNFYRPDRSFFCKSEECDFFSPIGRCFCPYNRSLLNRCFVVLGGRTVFSSWNFSMVRRAIGLKKRWNKLRMPRRSHTQFYPKSCWFAD